MADTPRFLTAARDTQARFMPDSCRIERSTGRYYDRATGQDVEEFTLVWEGRCRFPRADASGRVVVTGETITPATPTVKVPWNATPAHPDDRVTCTDSVTPASIGRVLWVTDNSPRTFQSAITLTCREVR